MSVTLLISGLHWARNFGRKPPIVNHRKVVAAKENTADPIKTMTILTRVNHNYLHIDSTKVRKPAWKSSPSRKNICASPSTPTGTTIKTIKETV